MIDVIWLDPSGLDQAMVRDLLTNEIWKPVRGFEFRHTDSFEDVQGDGAVVILPGGYQDVNVINEAIAKLKWVLVMIVSDENNLFPVEELKHGNMKVWVQMPRYGRDYGNVRYFGVGYAEARNHEATTNKIYDVFVSGQNTHARRRKIFQLLDHYKLKHKKRNVALNKTKGFTQGMRPAEYYRFMSQTKIAPAPSGTVSPDSFRVYEALEMGAIPIADDLSPAYDSKGYWAMLFPDTPMPILGDDNIVPIIETELKNYPIRSAQIFAWWQQQKRQYTYDLKEDLDYLTNKLVQKPVHYSKRITVIIPVSVWKSHPDTAILEETIQNARKQLPGAEIIVTFDGVREEQMDRYDDYYAFVSTMLHKFNREYKNVLPLVFPEHTHQAGMMREAMKYVRTESVLYNEGDSPLYADREIDWDTITSRIEVGVANVIRLYNKAEIPPEHDYLMFPEEDIESLNLKATSQWSQQPHVASSNFYREILDPRNGHFTENAKCFIEDKIYYIIVSDSGNGHWRKWRMFIYLPDNQPRSYHLDGRSGEPKWDDRQVF